MYYRFLSFLILFCACLLVACDRNTSELPIAENRATFREGEPLPRNKGDWPWWRGPTFDGIAEDQKVPHHWSETENIVWKVPLPGIGHGSPIVVDDRIFLPTANDQDQTMSLLCLDRESGKLLWDKESSPRRIYAYAQKKFACISNTCMGWETCVRRIFSSRRNFCFRVRPGWDTLMADAGRKLRFEARVRFLSVAL